MKKHIAFMISCIMLAVCFCFPGYALEYYAYTDNTSFDYGDVSLAAKLTGVVSNNSGSNDEYGWDFDYTFTVTLTNKTSEFQVADSNNFMFLFNSGYSDYFTKAQFANAFELLESSDNTSNISWEGYGSALRFTFYDSELLVLNPNETRTYTFLIRQHFPFNVNIAWYNNSINQSSLTYNSASSITISTKPSVFTSNTVEDFIANDSFPNSAIAWLIASYEQGIVDQEKYDEIINILSNQYNSIYQNTGGVGYYWQYGSWASSNDNNISGYYYITSPGSIVVDYDYSSSGLNQNNYNYDAIYDIPVYISLSLENISNSVYTFPSVGYLQIPVTLSPSLNGSTFIGYEFEVVNNTGLILSRLQAQNIILGTTLLDNGKNMIEGNTRYNIVICKHNYYGVVGDNVNTNKPTINSSSITYSVPSIVFVKGSYDGNNTPWSLFDIRQKLQQLIDGNTSANQDISDESGTVSDTQDQIHEQEQQWYSDNESAIEATGLSNFEFSSGELDGLTQLRLQFAQVWGALGDWTLVYIFVLSLSLATFILRHRPTTKAQQRMADSAKYRQDVRDRWAALDARASNNSNGFSDEIWRRAGFK